MLAASLGAVGLPAWGASSQVWKNRTRAERETGELKGVALGTDGMLALGPAFATVATSADPYLWSLARDSKGTIYAGGGNEGKVYRVGKGGSLELFFDAPELEVHALAVDSKDQVYVGTSPRGKIYRLTPAGKMEEYFAPGETYIWSLLFDAKGTLYAGTGTQGKLFKITGPGKGEVLLDTEETHIRVLASGEGGMLLAGTDGKGTIYEITPAGKSRVLATAPLPEVTALLTGPAKRIYFSAAGQSLSRAAPRPAPAPAPPRPAEEERPAGQQPQEAAPAAPPPQQPATPPPPAGAGVESKIVALDADGYAREIWSQTGELVMSLALDADGNLLAGGGTDGKILRIDPQRSDSSLLHKTDSAQVTALLREPDGSILAAGSNLGALYRLGGKVALEGTFQSPVHDAKVFSGWGSVSARGETPPGTALQLQVRTGNTAEPDSSWSEWSGPIAAAPGGPIDRPKGRYVQWKATLKSDSGKSTPRLGEVSISYLPRNLPPEVKSVEVQSPGVIFQKPNRTAGATASPADGAATPGRGDREKAAQKPVQQPRSQSDRDGRAAQWGASDPNGDSLVYSVYYRATDEREWKLMERDLTDPFYSWDATSLADGTYLLRVVADDSPSNPEGASLSAERLSDPFDVDNNPPAFSEVKATLSGQGASVEFEVTDTFSNLGDVIYSVNAQPWEAATPTDGITDSPRETYRVQVARVPQGEVSIVLKATDAVGNSTTIRTRLPRGGGGR
jgi:hypothetical protein